MGLPHKINRLKNRSGVRGAAREVVTMLQLDDNDDDDDGSLANLIDLLDDQSTEKQMIAQPATALFR